MTRFDINLSILFSEVALTERPAAAALAGFDAVEFWWPFATAVPADQEVEAFVSSLDDAGVRLVGLNFFAGDMPGGDRGLVSLPNRVGEFRDSVDVLVGIAERTGCRAFNALYGHRLEGVDPARQDDVAAENLSFAARAVAPLGGVVLVEPLAQGENGPYPLLTADDVCAVLDRVEREGGVGNARLLGDFYHLASNGEDWRRVIEADADRFGHVQIADLPGRHQPGTGGLDFAGIFGALESAGYPGYVGLEYKPLGPSAESFDWLPREQRSAAGVTGRTP